MNVTPLNAKHPGNAGQQNGALYAGHGIAGNASAVVEQTAGYEADGSAFRNQSDPMIFVFSILLENIV